MNKYQWITLIAAAVNLALVWLFPPYDYISATRNNVPTFDGFHFMFSQQGSNLQVNSTFLQLEFLVILLNAAIAWLLLKGRSEAEGSGKKSVDWQRIVLIGVGITCCWCCCFRRWRTSMP